MSMMRTARLLIRPFHPGDYLDLFEYLSLAEIYTYEPGAPLSLAGAKELAAERSQGTNFLAAILQKEMKLIGHVSLFPVERKECATWEIGYIFSPTYQNQGFATEAAKAVIAYAFNELGAHRVRGRCNPDNVASRRVLEKCGLTREAHFRQNVFFRRDRQGRPIWVDTYEYAILCDDIQQQAQVSDTQRIR